MTIFNFCPHYSEVYPVKESQGTFRPHSSGLGFGKGHGTAFDEEHI